MHDKYLGDSYDLVKRFWSVNLHAIAPLHAHPKFVPEEIRGQFTIVTKIPILDLKSVPKGRFGILLDPDTGIPLPKSSGKHTAPSHAPLAFMVQVMEELHPQYMICFDQSFHRQREPTKKEQMQTKMEFLSEHGFASFYYVSHAPFLFTTKTTANLGEIRTRLMSLGIPANLLELGATRGF